MRYIEIVLDAVWYFSKRGIVFGGGAGALFGTLYAPLFGTIFGAAFGGIFGLFIGIITGTLIGIIAVLFFAITENQRAFNLIILVVGTITAYSGAFTIFAMWWVDQGTLLERIVRLSRDEFMIIPVILAGASNTYLCSTYATHFHVWQAERNDPFKWNATLQQDREVFLR